MSCSNCELVGKMAEQLLEIRTKERNWHEYELEKLKARVRELEADRDNSWTYETLEKMTEYALEERARIVAWLRDPVHGPHGNTSIEIADAIEKCEHTKVKP